jgi:hypothetical protein
VSAESRRGYMPRSYHPHLQLWLNLGSHHYAKSLLEKSEARDFSRLVAFDLNSGLRNYADTPRNIPNLFLLSFQSTLDTLLAASGRLQSSCHHVNFARIRSSSEDLQPVMRK